MEKQTKQKSVKAAKAKKPVSISFLVNMAKTIAKRHRQSLKDSVRAHYQFYLHEVHGARTPYRKAQYQRYLNSTKRVARAEHISLA